MLLYTTNVNYEFLFNLVISATQSVNNRVEQEEKQCKNVRKQQREESPANDEVALQCVHPGCVITAVNTAGLVNRKKQRDAFNFWLSIASSAGSPLESKVSTTINGTAVIVHIKTDLWPVSFLL